MEECGGLKIEEIESVANGGRIFNRERQFEAVQLA